MVNAEFLNKMKSDAVLINTARGSVVNDEALLAKLEESKDFWMGTDVFNGEPGTGTADWSCALSMHPRVYGTHHCGASTAQAESAIGAEALRVILKFATTGEVDAANCVNRAKKESTHHKITVRHASDLSVHARIFEVLAMHKLNVQEMSNMVFADRQAAVMTLAVAGDADMKEVQAALVALENVHDVSL